MARRASGKNTISWELIGMAAILAVFAFGFIIWLAAKPNSIKEPAFSSFTGPDGAELPSGVDADGRPTLGSPDAPVTFYEFADFQCSHCKLYTTDHAAGVKEAFVATGQAKLVFVNAPFGGTESEAAAKAALCAGQQGKFWAMHDWLFQNQALTRNQGGFSQERLEEIAGKVGLDLSSFKACQTDPSLQDHLDADEKLLASKGVDSTPTFLVGEAKVVGADGEGLKKALQEAVDAAK